MQGRSPTRATFVLARSPQADAPIFLLVCGDGFPQARSVPFRNDGIACPAPPRYDQVYGVANRTNWILSTERTQDKRLESIYIRKFIFYNM